MAKKNRAFICLYDRTETEDNSEEDILQKAFGGDMTSSTLICRKCNNTLGNTIDKALANGLQWIITLTDTEGRRGAAPTLKNMPDSEQRKWHLSGGGQPSVPYRQISENTWEADAGQEELVRKNAEAKARAKGIANPIIEIKRERIRSSPMQFRLELDPEMTFRSACKTALEALAVIAHFSDDERKSDLLLDARTFVMRGGTYPNVGWLYNSILPNAFGTLDHYVVLMQHADLSVHWEFILYGGIVAVGGRFGPINNKFGSWVYRVCPKTGDTDKGTVEGVLPPNFRNWFSEITSQWQARLEALLYQLQVELIVSFVGDEVGRELEDEGVTDAGEFERRASEMMAQRSLVAIAEWKHQMTAGTAYELWLQKGSGHGHDLQDWFDAEKRLWHIGPKTKIGNPIPSGRND